MSLSDFRGQSVLLYFHEGSMCQPCFTQIADLEAEWDKLAAVGIDELVTITVDPVDRLAQKMRDDGLSSIALSDPDLEVSKQYTAEQYGMMDGTTPGHSFLLCRPRRHHHLAGRLRRRPRLHHVPAGRRDPRRPARRHRR